MQSTWTIVPLALAVLTGDAFAKDAAYRLPDAAASRMNDLNRALYACTSGASHFVSPLPEQDHTEFPPVLGEPYNRKPGENILRLSGTTLTGIGNTVRTDDKVNRFTFTCELTSDLKEATAFNVADVQVVDPLPDPTGPDPKILPDGATPVWAAHKSGTTATLTHGVKGTNDFEATCANGSGRFTWHIPFAPSQFEVGAEVSVNAFFQGDRATQGLYVAKIIAAPNSKTPSMTTTISTVDPMLQWLERNDELDISAFGDRIAISLKGSSAPVKEFAAACGS